MARLDDYNAQQEADKAHRKTGRLEGIHYTLLVLLVITVLLFAFSPPEEKTWLWNKILSTGGYEPKSYIE